MLSQFQIAQVCHAACRELQTILGDPVPSPPWADAPASQIKSVTDGVVEAARGADPEQLHDRWMAGKQAAGWVYGPVKSEAEKTHPCLVPYDQLPAGQKKKDDLLYGIVNALTEKDWSCSR